MRCARCGREITQPVRVGDKTYGCECARLFAIEKEEVKQKFSAVSTIRPKATVDIDGAPIAVDSNDLTEHIKSLGMDDGIEVTISYDPDPYFFEYCGEEMEAAASYSHPEGVITFYSATNNYPEEEILEVLTHEYGHAIWYQLLDSSNLSDWKIMYEKACETKRFVSDYASGMVEEYFAESFMTYVHDPNLLRSVSPKAYRWIETKIFNGREFDAGQDIQIEW